MSEVKYPNITVKLTESDGNAFAILGVFGRELRRHNIPKNEITVIMNEAMNGDYDHLLQTVMKTVNVE